MKKKIAIGTVGILGLIALSGSGSDTPTPEPIVEKQEQVIEEVEIPPIEEIVEVEIDTKEQEVIESKPITKKEVPKPEVSTIVTPPKEEVEPEPEIIEEPKKDEEVIVEEEVEEEPVDEEPVTTDRNGPYYTSSHHSAKFYYPRKCSQWEDLSKSYLRSYGTVGELLDSYSRKIHPDC